MKEDSGHEEVEEKDVTKLEFGRIVVGDEDAVAGDSPGTRLGIFRREWPSSDAHVYPLHC